MENKTNSSQIVKKLIPWLFAAVLILIVIGFLGDLGKIKEIISRFNWILFPIPILCTTINYILRFIKWHYYLQQIGAGCIPWKESLRLFVSGFPLAVTPGKIGEVIKAMWIEERSNVPAAKGIAVVLAERISDGFAVMLLSLMGIFYFPEFWPIFLFVFIALILVLIAFQFKRIGDFFITLCGKIPVIKRFQEGIRQFYDGSFELFQPKQAFFAIALGTVSWFFEGVGFYVILLGLGFEPGGMLFISAVFILAFSTVIGAVSTLPGGIGAIDLSISGMFLVIVQDDAAMAATAGQLIRIATFWYGIVLGLGAWVISPELIKGRQPEIVEHAES